MRSYVKALLGLALGLFLFASATADDKINYYGDLRLRYEGIKEDGEHDRDRGRFRARLGLVADISQDFDFVFQLASGRDNPVSTNQDFDDGFSLKDIRLDLGYFDWAVADSLHLYVGKMNNPLFRAGKAPLVWDGDFNPEGIAAAYSRGIFFGTLGGFLVEKPSAESETKLVAIQAGINVAVAENAKLRAGAGYFAYSNAKGNEPFHRGDSRGNSVDSEGNYVYGYKNAEIFAQLDIATGSWPLSVFAHWTKNSETDEQDTGYALGGKIGSANKNGAMEISWTYMDLEADSVVATFPDSDFGGGGTDSSGHMIKGKYILSDNISLGGTYFINEVDRIQGDKHDYNRLQLDIEFSFE